MPLSIRHRTALRAATVLLCLAAAAGSAAANERQTCLNQCTQTGATEQAACKGAYDAEMVRCGTLQTNAERNTCKRTANQTLKRCNESARAKIKQCQTTCPPKR